MKIAKLKSLLMLILIPFASSIRVSAEWKSLGPYGGHALKIVLDPKDPQHLFVATKNGQLYHSTDAGERWMPLPFRVNANAALHAIALSPTDSRVLYVGVAENSTLLQSAGVTGVYRSQDGGQSWTLLPGTRNWPVLSLAIHPRQSDTIVVGTMQGVFRSENRGAEWKRISPVNHPDLKGVVSLALDPVDSQVIYAGTPHLPWRTLDGGASWTSIHRGMIDDSDVFSITVDRTDSQRVFASACSGIYRSSSRGEQWTKMQGIPGTNRRTHLILQDPKDERIIYAGTTQGLWKSSDGGITWRKANSYPYVINSIAIDPTNHNRLYLATDRSGILKSQDGGATFQATNEGFTNRNIGGFLGEETLYLSSLYDGDFGGIFSSVDAGRSWKLNANQAALRGKNVISLAVSPVNPKLIYAGTYEGLLKSEDGGLSWHPVTGGVPRATVAAKGSKIDSRKLSTASAGVKLPETKVFDVRISPVAPSHVCAATAQGLFQSSDGGKTWSKNSGLTGAVYKLGLHPSDPSWMMVQTSARLYVSGNRGGTWVETHVGNASVRVHDFAFSSSMPVRVLAGTSHGLYASVDGGKSWNPHSGGLPMMAVNQFCTSKQQPGLIYFLSQSENQIYLSTDGGERWTRFDDGGLRGLSIQAMTSSVKQVGSLFVLTENQGVWMYRPGIIPGSREAVVAGTSR
jgi:photosystem II stability/assembly factor-like uncharacterized protein